MSITQLREMAPEQTATVEVTQGEGTWLIPQAAALGRVFASRFSYSKAKDLTMWMQQFHSFTALPLHFFKDLTAG